MDEEPRTFNQIDVTSMNKLTSPPRNMPNIRPMCFRSNLPCFLFKNGRCMYGQYCRFSHVYGNANNVAMNENVGQNRNFVQNDRNNVAMNVNVGLNRSFVQNDRNNVAMNENVGKNRNFVQSNRNNVAMNEGQNRSLARNEMVTRTGKTGYRMSRPCYKWEATGSCFKGADCIYAHGQEELGRIRSQFGVQQEVASNSRMRPATTAPDGSLSRTADWPCGTADGSATDPDKKWKMNKKLNGVYADWIDGMSLMHRSVDEEGI